MTTKGIIYQDFEKLPHYIGFKHKQGKLIDFGGEEYGFAQYQKGKDHILVFEKLHRMNGNHAVWELLDTIRVKEPNNKEWSFDTNGEQCQDKIIPFNQFVVRHTYDPVSPQSDTFKAEQAWRFDFINRKLLPMLVKDILCIEYDPGCVGEDEE